jgi:hypothetical protein
VTYIIDQIAIAPGKQMSRQTETCLERGKAKRMARLKTSIFDIFTCSGSWCRPVFRDGWRECQFQFSISSLAATFPTKYHGPADRDRSGPKR